MAPKMHRQISQGHDCRHIHGETRCAAAAWDKAARLWRIASGGRMKRVRLEQTALFRLLGPKSERVRPLLRTARFETGETLYFEGGAADCLYAVKSGEVRTLKDHAGGRSIELERCGAGDLFGLAALTGASRHGESAQGLVAGEVWRLPRRAVHTLLEEDPAIARGLLAIVAERLEHAHDRLCSFAGDAVPARLARALLAAQPGERIATTRRALGESAGTTVETAIRVLRRFERAGWVEGGVGWLRVLDRDALEGVASGSVSREPGREQRAALD
jgi:CRP/FNR family transcriptional regulator